MNNKVRPTSALRPNQPSVERKPLRSVEHADDVHAYDRHVDALAESFFNRESSLDIDFEDDQWHAHPPRGSSRAMHATLVMLAVSLVTLAAFIVYMRLIMPVPVELGAGGDVVLPHPESSASQDAKPDTHATDVNHEATPSDVQATSPPSDATPAQQDERTGPTSERAIDASTQMLVTTAPDAASPEAEPIEPARVAVGVASRQRPPALVRNDLVHRAYGSLNRGDAPEALMLARKAVIESPKRADAWIALGSAYDALHDRDGARRAFRSCLELADGPYLPQCRSLSSN